MAHLAHRFAPPPRLRSRVIPAALVLCASTVALSPVAALPAAVASSAEETAEPKSHENTIKWSTSSEVDNFGFDIFRSENEEGPFEKLNKKPIEGGGTTDSPRHYQYVDTKIDPHAVYYYYVESIALDGTREQFTPIAKVGPKVKPEEDERP